MAITPINNAMIQRTADVNLVKHQEDSKPFVDQQNIQVQVDHREDVLNHQVIDPAKSNETKNDADAKDEGRGTKYKSRASGGKAKSESGEVNRVVKKQNVHRFDMKV